MLARSSPSAIATWSSTHRPNSPAVGTPHHFIIGGVGIFLRTALWVNGHVQGCGSQNMIKLIVFIV